MKKWLTGAVDRLVAKATRRATEKVAEEATERAVRKARAALDRAENALFGPDETDPKRAVDAADAREQAEERAEERPGALQKAREDADRRAKERIAADAASEKKKQAEIDDELARMKKRIGKR